MTKSFKMAAHEHTGTVLRSDEATEYLNKHRILELLNNLTAQLIYTRPDNPKGFLIETLEKLVKSRSKRLNYPCLFDDSNIQSVYGMLDPTGRGYVTVKQYQEAMKTLGCKDYDPTPHGSDIDRINLDTFSREAKQGLASASATFQEYLSSV